MTRRVTPEEAHDWQAGVMPPVRRLPQDLWIAGLVGAIAGGLSMLLMMAFLESLPNAGALNGCAELSAAECTIFAQEGR